MHVSAGRRRIETAPGEPGDSGADGSDWRGHDAAEPLAAAEPHAAAEPLAAPLPAHGSLLLAALVAALIGHGALRPLGQRVVAALLLSALAALLLQRRGDRRSLWAVGLSAERARFLRPFPLLAALAGWAVVSAASNGGAARAVSTGGTLAGVALVLLLCSHLNLPQRRRLVSSLAGLGLIVAVSGWAGVAWRISPLVTEGSVHLGATTITYTNAAAAILAPLTLLALALGMERRNTLQWTATACVMLVGFGAAASRGGLVALLVGLVVLAVGLGPGSTLRAAAPPALGAVIALAGLLPSVPANSSPQPLLAVVALVLGLVVAAALRSARFSTLVAAGAACGLVGLLALTVGPLTGPARSLAHAKAVNGWSERDDLAYTGLEVAGRHPVLGTGPGGSRLTWVADDGRTRHSLGLAHNEYVQALVDLGVVGLALVLALLAALGRVVAGGRASSPSPGVWVACAAGLIAFAVHSGADVLWHLPALPLCLAVLVGVNMPTPAEHR